MNRIITLLLITVFTLSCDDGDIAVTVFNFDNVEINTCENVLYKINGDELLLIDIPSDSFTNSIANIDTTPTLLNIGGTNNVYYRRYNKDIVHDSFCTVIPPADVVVLDQWTASSGSSGESGLIQIITTENLDETTGVVIGHNHEIRLLNMVFSSGDTTLVYDNYLVGTHTTTL